MNCPQCGAPVDDGAKNCKYCGESIAEPQNNVPSQMNQMPMNPMQMQGQTMFCPNCGKEMKANDKFCGGCGYSVQNNFVQNTVANVDNISQNEKILGAAAHLALMLGVIIASIVSEKSNSLLPLLLLLLFLIAPFIYFRVRRNMIFASKHALQAFLWQTAVLMIISLTTWFANYHSTGSVIKDMYNGYVWIGEGVSMLVMLVSPIFMIYAAYKSLRGREYKYPFMPRDMTKNKWIVVAVCLLFFVCGVIFKLITRNNYINW